MPKGPTSVSSVSEQWQRAFSRGEAYRALLIFTPHLPSLLFPRITYLVKNVIYENFSFQNFSAFPLTDGGEGVHRYDHGAVRLRARARSL